MADLNDLFEQIFHSERDFKARIDQMKELNTQIEECQFKLEQTKEALHTKQGELAVKNSKLADVEMEVKLLQIRKAIKQAQKCDLIEAKEKTSREYDDTVSELATKQLEFKERLKEFSRSHDLHGAGLRYRENEAKKMINVLQDELILLETEMVEIENFFEDIEKLQVELVSAEAELEQEKERERDIKARLSEKEACLQQLEKEKISIVKIFNNAEWRRLQSELNTCKNSHEEETCKKLSTELEELQKECYHKQMKLQTARQNKSATSSKKAGSNPPFNLTSRGQYHPAGNASHAEREGVDHYSVDSEVDLELSSEEVEDDWADIDIDDVELDMFEEDLPQLSPFENSSEQFRADNKELTDCGREDGCSDTLREKAPNLYHHQHNRSSRRWASNARGTGDFVNAKNLVEAQKRLQTSSGTQSRLTSRPTSAKVASTVLNTPEVARKRPGESIFKANSSREAKKAKKVRFHY